MGLGRENALKHFQPSEKKAYILKIHISILDFSKVNK